MKQLFISLFIIAVIFIKTPCFTNESATCCASDLFDLEFSLITTPNHEEELLLKLITVEKKPNLAPLILQSKRILEKDGEKIMELTICHDKEAFSAQVFGKRLGHFLFRKGDQELPEGIYLLKINNQVYGQLYLSDTVAFQPSERIEE